MVNLSNNLRQLRLQNNVTHQQVADAVGIPIKSYQLYEYNYCNPSLEVVLMLAEFYNLTVEQLLGACPKAESTVEQKIALAPQHIKNAIYTLLEI